MTEERDYESEARAEGWVPEGEWKGDPSKWKPAQEFVEAGENILPIVKSKLDKALESIDKVEQDLSKQKQVNQQLSEFFNKAQEKDKREVAMLREQLERAQSQAIAESDGEAFLKAQKQLNDLEDPAPAQAQLTPDQMAWLESNDWYGRNQKLTRNADMIATDLANEGYVDQSPAYFKELTRRVKEDFPDEFGNKNRGRPNPVEVPESKKTDSKEQTYDNLPADARAACDEFVSQGFMTKDEYISNYDWEQANV